MKRFWLIQTGDFKKTPATSDLDSLVSLHYMGAAEYEWGALPRSLVRLLTTFDEYKFYPTGICNSAGDELFVFTKSAEVSEMVKEFINQPYELKEHCYLENIQKPEDPERPSWAKRYSFWWCIDKPNRFMNEEVGDWMACFKSKAPLLEETLKNHLSEWQNLPEEEKKKRLREW